MKLFCSSFFPVSRTFSALMTTTKSPVSTCGVKIVFAFPRNKLAAFTATWPRIWSLASITHHLRGTSLALAEKVFIRAERARKLRDALRSVKYSRETRLALSTLFCMLVFSFLSVSEYPAAPQGVFPREAKWRMKEGLGVIKEVVRFLRTIRPEQPLALSPGMCRAAADHCADQAAGHRTSRQRPQQPRRSPQSLRNLERALGRKHCVRKTTARAIILALIIDDDRPTRTHRKNIFDPSFNCAGDGPHALHGSVCPINFTSRYTEQPANAVIGRNF